MSFGISDLITVAVIENGLNHLRDNPDHLNFILSPFCNIPEIRKMVGGQYIAQCIEYVTQNRLYVAPYYEADHTRIPSVVTVARTGEEQQFLGDYGHECQNMVFEPIVYGTFDVTDFEQDRTVMFVPKSSNVENFLWPNVWVKNGNVIAQVRGIHVQDDKDTRILLNSAIPVGTNMKGWVSQSSKKRTGYVINSNVEGVEISCKLTTSGDYSIHRLMSIVVRYCLKRGRMLFENYGLQAPIVSQAMPIIENGGSDAPAIYSTVFSVKGKLGEHWITKEFDYPDASDSIGVDWVAQSEGKVDVPVE